MTNLEKFYGSMKELSFELHTIQWQSHAPKGSEYDEAWNNAISAVEKEINKRLEQFFVLLCHNCGRDIDSGEEHGDYGRCSHCGHQNANVIERE